VVNSGISALWIVAIPRRAHLVLAGEVQPELEAFHAAVFLLGQLGVDHAAPGRHPLDAAVLQQPFVAALSRWRMRPAIMYVTVSKPRCGWSGKPPM
jgi:hypothetical protein